MTEAYIVAGAMTRFGKYKSSSYAGLAVPPLVEALRESGLKKAEVQAVFCGHSYGGMLTAQRITKEIGLGGVPAVNVDNACSGGATAVSQAIRSVQSGQHEVVIALGVEKLTQFSGGTLPLPEEDREVQRGIVMPAVYAMRAQRYLYETDATIEDFAAVSVKARRHGSMNPFAQMRAGVTAAEVLESRPIADPFTLLMCCPTGDGAAVVVIVSERVRKRLGGKAVSFRASVLHSGEVAEGFRDMTDPQITTKSAAEAYEQAGLGPEDLDVIELHDAFSSAEIMYYESFGLAEKGRGFELIRAGETTFGGRVVVNPSGGLLAKGHPVGASGVAQIVELFWQLTGTAGERQVDGARFGLAHVTGGGISGLDHGACAVHILEST
ncbi:MULTISPECIES: thiolase family protein [unclassified Cryobacterium]|uniref:thiolase family protein n=1 Tax=unclassified Cryobacterium TaxID=2649013 RepID=UPI0010699C11|nr:MULTISPECIES: thiolase family protein [unclassified Cryobacterium]TFD02990.1 thiolase family protein [Cryobacterium sp. TMT1-66-1]TFD15346.1 thiolase family protein [Cryobacterium sp. TMT1-2-2]